MPEGEIEGEELSLSTCKEIFSAMAQMPIAADCNSKVMAIKAAKHLDSSTLLGV